jgi:hypothetical protein
LLNDQDFSFTEHGHGKLLGESLSERLSDCCPSRCQRASVIAAVVRVAAVRVAAVREAAVRVAAVKVAAVIVAAVRVAAVRVAAVRVAAVRVAVRLIGSQSQQLNHSIRCYYSSIQLETF